jgi:hypothetical protein
MPVQVVAEESSTEMVGSVYEGVQEKSICEVPSSTNPTQFATNPHNSPTCKQQLVVFVVVMNKIIGFISM